jgi:predicted hotdog family 3-hydroxylacyl-ACP dehydratase
VPIDSLPLAVAPLIPHGATIRMVDRLTQVGERQAMAEFLVPDSCPFVDADGRLDETAYVELIVQTLAACQGFHLPSEEQTAHRGLLLGVNNLQITGESRVGDHLNIHVLKTTRFGGFGVVEGVVYHRDGREVARGESKVWQGGTDSAGVFG